MEETKRALSAGQAESAKECAGARIEGERNNNPQKILYHGNNGSSIPKKKNLPFCMGFVDKTCAWCGKNFVPTRPEYAWGDCCSYTCCLRYDEKKQDALKIAREVVMVHPEKGTDIMKFDSAKAAADFAGVEPSKIRNVCNGISETSGGYAWRWADEERLKPSDVVPDFVPEKKTCMTVWVRDSMYKQLEELAAKNGVSRNRMVTALIEKEFSK
jgi:hypothetical protein